MRTLLIIILTVCFSVAFGQQITIKGMVTDASTQEPIPFANVFVAGKFQGTVSDINGNYQISVGKGSDSLGVSVVGYTKQVKPIGTEAIQQINFAMTTDDFMLEAVVVNPGENPASVLYKQLLKNKAYHNYNEYPTASYETYTKYQVDIDNIDEKSFDENKLFNLFPMLKGYVDSSSHEGSSTLPIFLVENLSDNYYQAHPKKYIERVKGVKMSGLEKQDFITEMLGNVNQNMNIHENMITVMGKSFVSPVADYGLNTYKYYLNYYDTLYVDGYPHLEMKFKPKRKNENTFKGVMLVDVQNYAVRSIEAEISEGVNIGFVENLTFSQSFAPIPGAEIDSVVRYAPSDEVLNMKFNYVIGKNTRIVGKKTKSYKGFVVGKELDEDVFNTTENTLIEEEAHSHDDNFWEEHRHTELMDTEKGIYEMVDSLKRTKRYRVIQYAGRTVTTGYAWIGKRVGLGNVTQIVSRNSVEGWRFRLGFQTTVNFSQRVQLEGYTAYGLDDQSFKWGFKTQFIFAKRPWNKLAIRARDDVDFMSRHAEEMDRDNVFTMLSKKGTQRLYRIAEYGAVYDRQLHNDLAVYVGLTRKHINPYFDFSYEKNGEARHDIYSSETSVALKYQRDSKVLPGTFNREANANQFFAQFRKKNAFPVMWLRYTYGFRDVIKSDFEFHDLSVGLQGDYTFTPKMSFYYNIWAGQIMGKLPFLLLKNPEGNFYYVHNKYFFNNMNLLEFTADRYVSGNFQYFLGGTILDKLPLIKKLKWRELVTANVFYGDMTQANRDLNKNNNVGIAYPIPYVEAGVGVENIFKFIRIDCIWRLTHLDKPNISKFGVYGSLFIKL